jgi:hypothetical protein
VDKPTHVASSQLKNLPPFLALQQIAQILGNAFSGGNVLGSITEVVQRRATSSGEKHGAFPQKKTFEDRMISRRRLDLRAHPPAPRLHVKRHCRGDRRIRHSTINARVASAFYRASTVMNNFQELGAPPALGHNECADQDKQSSDLLLALSATIGDRFGDSFAGTSQLASKDFASSRVFMDSSCFPSLCRRSPSARSCFTSASLSALIPCAALIFASISFITFGQLCAKTIGDASRRRMPITFFIYRSLREWKLEVEGPTGDHQFLLLFKISKLIGINQVHRRALFFLVHRRLGYRYPAWHAGNTMDAGFKKPEHRARQPSSSWPGERPNAAAQRP